MRSRLTFDVPFLPVSLLCVAFACAPARSLPIDAGRSDASVTTHELATTARAPETVVIAPRAVKAEPSSVAAAPSTATARATEAPKSAPAALATKKPVAAKPAAHVDPAAEVASVIALGKSDNRVMEHLDHLANRIGPRLTGSRNFRIACEWAREQFASFGLENARLEAWGEFPVGFNRGPSSGRVVTPSESVLHFATNAWTAGTCGPVRGHVVIAPANEAELDAVRGKLSGAWVLAPTPTQPARGENRRNETPQASNAPSTDAKSTAAVAGAPSSSDAPRREPAAERDATAGRTTTSEAGAAREPRARDAARRNDGPDAAFRKKRDEVYDEIGVAGVIQSGRGDLVLTGGNYRIEYAKLPKRASITLLASEFDSIKEKVEKGEDVELELDVRNWFEKGPIEVHNVIAEIPGTEKPEEVVIVGGHLDSWDGATGTTDNGTGVATTMEAARLLAKAGVHPKRTIRFMLFGGEEQGLLGSAAYVKAHKDEMEKISAVLVHDGGTNYCGGITATPPMVQPLTDVFAPITDLDPEQPFKVREVKGLSGGGSDHASFLAANVPGFFWSQRGRANYNHTHHTQFDTYDAAIPEYQRNSAIVIAVGALGIANLPDLLSRDNLRAPSGGGFGGRRLGVQLTDDMTIEEVTEDGLAKKAGLLAGDRLVKIGGRAITDRDEMRNALTSGPAKTKVTVMRGGKEIEVDVEFPADDPSLGLTRRLGVRFGDGTTIDVVTPGGAGDQAGIQAGDRIVRVGDQPVTTTAEAVSALPPQGSELKLVLRRDGKEVNVTIKP